jgi:hypothetical protein
MVGIESVSRSQEMKRLLVVTAIFVILVSSVVIVDVTSAGYEYDMPEPSLSHGFPESIFFYNISEGVTSNIFSIIVELPANLSSHHHIVPRDISLLFWFRDASDGSDLSSFIYDLSDTLPMNSSSNIIRHWRDLVGLREDDWWAPSLISFTVDEGPTAEAITIGSAFDLVLVNAFGDSLDTHELNVRLEMNVTYSWWWYGLSVSKTHQTVEYDFNFPDDGIADIVSLEYGLP